MVVGGEIESVDAFWANVADKLGVFPDEEFSGSSSRRSTSDSGVSGGVGVGGTGIRAQRREGNTDETREGGRQRRRRPLSAAAKEALQLRQLPLVIDDFHYVDRAVQMALIRNLKDLVFEGVPLILASVPHRAFDAVRVEREMTGRVEQLSISFWQPEELLGIARSGFEALNITAPPSLRAKLVEESFSSPYLMQDFCLELCKANGVRTAPARSLGLTAPDWDAFFEARATSASQTAFDLLARGPRQRRDRIERRLKDGRTTDIYGVVLEGIAYTGPLTKLTYEELRAAIREIVADPPQRQEITRVLEEMSKIAREQIEGEPVVDYDGELGTLFISDPFFAYYLRWGSHEASFS